MLKRQLQHFVSTNKNTFFSFITVGAIAALINFSSFAFFLQQLSLNYAVSISFSFILSVIFHFTANRYFTFKSRDVNFYHQLPKYLSMVLFNYVVTLCVMYFVVELRHLSPYLGNVIAIGMTVMTGYMLSRYWVFTKVQN